MIIIGDLHFKNKEPFKSSLFSFLDWIYENYKDETIIQLGDLFDTSSPHNEIEEQVLQKLIRYLSYVLCTVYT